MTTPDDGLPDHVRRNREAWVAWACCRQTSEEVWIARKRA
jgi:hypothetical protein